MVPLWLISLTFDYMIFTTDVSSRPDATSNVHVFARHFVVTLSVYLFH
jgi:hypothetical protein